MWQDGNGWREVVIAGIADVLGWGFGAGDNDEKKEEWLFHSKIPPAGFQFQLLNTFRLPPA